MFLHLTHFESQEICVCIRSHFGLQPFRPLQSCMLDHLEDTPILSMIFGQSGTAAPSPKPLVKRRASPLKESPARDEEDETSDCHNRMLDLDKTVQNVEQVCKYFHMDESKAKQITDLILWRIERLSRLFSGCFRHDPKQGNHRECQRPVEMNPDGSVELYDALGCVTHAKNFMGNRPGLLLMAMLPDYGKARFEIAFVYPSVGGSYNERKAEGRIVPRNRWIDNLTSRSACDSLRRIPQ